MIEAYFDESGTHAGAKVLCVACYIGDRERWSFFEKEWSSILHQYPNIPYFHAKDPKCDVLRPYLARTILNCDLVANITTINPINYKQYTGAQFRSTLGNAYSVCALNCALKFKNWLNPDDRTAIIIEDGQSSAEHVEKLLKTLIGHPDYNIASIAIANKKDYLPLQAADFLAHVMSNRDIKWINTLATGNNLMHAHINKEQLHSISKQIKTLISLRRNIRKRGK